MRSPSIRFANVFLVLASLVASLAAAEIVLRVFFPEPVQTLLYDPRLIIAGEPNKQWTFRSDEYGAIDLRTNSDGFRGPEFPREGSPGTFRILIVGDSFVAATQVQERQRFGNLLGEHLGPGVEVVNMGVVSIDPIVELQHYRVLGRPMKPDLVIHAFYTDNDIEFPENDRFTLEGTGDAQRVASIAIPSTIVQPRGNVLLRNSYLLRLVLRFSYQVLRPLQIRARRLIWRADSPTGERKVRRLMDAAGFHTTFGLRELEEGSAWKTSMAIERTFRDDVERDGGQFRVMVIPSAFTIHADWRSEVMKRSEGLLEPEQWDVTGLDDRLDAELLGAHLRLIRLRPRFLAEAERGKHLFYRKDGHFNPDGHRVAADELEAAVRPLLRDWCRTRRHADNPACRPAADS